MQRREGGLTHLDILGFYNYFYNLDYNNNFITQSNHQHIKKSRTQETLNLLACVHSGTDTKQNILCVTFYVSHTTYHLSHVICHLSHVTNANSHILRPKNLYKFQNPKMDKTIPKTLRHLIGCQGVKVLTDPV